MSQRKRKPSRSSTDENGSHTSHAVVEVQCKRAKLQNGEPSETECTMNSWYRSKSFQSDFQNSWRNKEVFSDDSNGAVLLNDPFQCCVLPDFIHNPVSNDSSNDVIEGTTALSGKEGEGFLFRLKNELLRLKFYEKNNDLYQFHQSDDLKKFKRFPCISKLRSCFHSQVLPWLREVTGLNLGDVIDMTCSKYEFTDVLLCHDDELEGRRIAFIYYLVPEWTEEDGGALDLFAVDDTGRPNEVVKSLLPVWNNFVFFDVNTISFHQVAEVLSATKTRLSVNGWFHGPPPSRPTPFKETKLPMYPPISMGLDVLSDWINPLYLDVGVQEQIQQQFEADSQIELPDFVLEEKYSQLCEEMRLGGIKWTIKGPPNQRRVLLANSTSLPPTTKACFDVILSEPFCRLLSHLTGLDLVHNVIRSDSTSDKRPSSSSVAESGTLEIPSGHSNDEKLEKEIVCNVHVTSKDDSVNCSNSSSCRPCVRSGDGDDSGSKHQDSGDCSISSYSSETSENGVEIRRNSPQSQTKSAGDSFPINAQQTLDSTDRPPAGLCRGDLCCWKPGSYTLAGVEADPGLGKFCLDAILYFCCEGWSEDYGGMTSYIAKDADEELLTVTPTPNALSLVYRDEESLYFTKYLNHRATGTDAEGTHSTHAQEESVFCTMNAIYIETSESECKNSNCV